MSKELFSSVYHTDKELSSCGFRAVGKNVMIHENVNIYGIENISIGNNVRIDAYASIIATGQIILGSYIHIGSFCLLAGGDGIVMEDFSGLSPSVRIFTRSDDYTGQSLTNPTVPEKYKLIKKGKVVLKKHVIIGCGSIILPSVIIGEGSSVGALSLVNKNLPEWGIYSGVPAKRLKDRSKNLLKIEAELLKDCLD